MERGVFPTATGSVTSRDSARISRTCSGLGGGKSTAVSALVRGNLICSGQGRRDKRQEVEHISWCQVDKWLWFSCKVMGQMSPII